MKSIEFYLSIKESIPDNALDVLASKFSMSRSSLVVKDRYGDKGEEDSGSSSSASDSEDEPVSI